MILEETNIRSRKSFQGTVVFPEPVCLEPFLEGRETVSVSDGSGGASIEGARAPPLQESFVKIIIKKTLNII